MQALEAREETYQESNGGYCRAQKLELGRKEHGTPLPWSSQDFVGTLV